MKNRIVPYIVPALLITASLSAQPALPPQVQADLLLQQIEANLEAGNAQEALDALAEYRKLGIKMPPTLMFLEGRLAAMTKDYARSKKALSEYLSFPLIKDDKNYQAALSLYSEVQRIARAEEDKAEIELVRNMNPECVTLRSAAKQTIESKAPRSEFQECLFAPIMVIVPAGDLSMGTDNRFESVQMKYGFGKTWPQRNVKLRPFAVGKYEVTHGEWMACVQAGGCGQYIPEVGRVPQKLTDKSRLPVRQVSWNDAQSYVTWLSKQTGHIYRLLSEAEWEYAARAGSMTRFNTGESLKASQANINGETLVEVGLYPPNGFGVYDMHGNVIEWVQDCWNPNFVGAPLDNSAWNEAGSGSDGFPPASCDVRVHRGGSFLQEADAHSLNNRSSSQSSQRHPNWGFRVARDIE